VVYPRLSMPGEDNTSAIARITYEPALPTEARGGAGARSPSFGLLLAALGRGGRERVIVARRARAFGARQKTPIRIRSALGSKRHDLPFGLVHTLRGGVRNSPSRPLPSLCTDPTRPRRAARPCEESASLENSRLLRRRQPSTSPVLGIRSYQGRLFRPSECTSRRSREPNRGAAQTGARSRRSRIGI
jgi:hypothetical protein